MATIEESILEIKKYLKKLAFAINNNASFSLFATKYIDKNKIDDIWVCVEANFPTEYKKLLRLPNDKKYKSVALYHQLKLMIHDKSKMFSSCYAINYNQAIAIISGFLNLCEQDIKMLYKSL